MVNVGIIGCGFVGAELIAQLHATRSSARRLKVVGITNVKQMLLSDKDYTPLHLTNWKSDLESKGVTPNLDDFIQYMAGSPEHAVIVDCTASEAVANMYPSWLKLNLSVVTPNKKAFSGQLSLFKEIHLLSANYSGNGRTPMTYHESTVGAGLPVLNTLTDLLKTGDEITMIEGIFSGTLSYLFNNFSSTSDGPSKGTFSEIVKVAKELGYTEPDPRDDLNGMDVARKVTICGRLAGLDLDLSTLNVENIVPEALRNVATADEFMTKLPEFDDHFSKLNEDAKKEGKVLRYVGVVDPKGNSGVKLMKYPADHPFAGLQGSDNIIKFTTKYFPNGIIIQGAGAGGPPTAYGIFSDLLKVQERVEGF
ncbi:homoserine dehydrogenase-domain-containing protein [Mycotypha africana]|uniref:homoserine dehydrogenase-domain-containing protein n=1 Tax=Mycotypha africana TaxID=64632 RepID=UPI0023010EE7|nr:homoserine dehydrogenase-domain-containing protein [Mycotypha africana]KAI8968271.1 homoserine dehydrogenase-domain-containing protein [Mycotypha africana]